MPVRIGFIGTGGMAGQHFQTLSQIEGAQPIAFCDLDKTRAEKAAHRFAHFAGRAYTDYKKLLEAESLDAVYICLPPHAHKDIEVLAAQKGCALFVEKPVANNLKTAERAAEAIENAGVINAVGYHFRYHAATTQVQELLADKKAPALVYGRWLGNFPSALWWRRQNQSGGQINEQATHIIDLARYLVGDIEKVYCCAARREMHKEFRDSTVADVTTLTAEFTNGAIGHFSAACLLGGVREVGLSLVVKDAIYDLFGNALSIRKTDQTQNIMHRNNAYLDEDKAFIEAVQTGKRGGIKSTYADALKTLRVTLAANQSAKSGRAVRIK